MKTLTYTLAALFIASIVYIIDLNNKSEIQREETHKFQLQFDSLKFEHSHTEKHLKMYVLITLEQQKIMQEKRVRNSSELNELMTSLY